MAISGLSNFASAFQALSVQSQSINRTTQPTKVDSLSNNFSARSDESRDRVKDVDSGGDSDTSSSTGSLVNPEGIGSALDVSA